MKCSTLLIKQSSSHLQPKEVLLLYPLLVREAGVFMKQFNDPGPCDSIYLYHTWLEEHVSLI